MHQGIQPDDDVQLPPSSSAIGYAAASSGRTVGEKVNPPCHASPLAGAWRRYGALYIDITVGGVLILALLALVGGIDLVGRSLAASAIFAMTFLPLVLGLCVVAYGVFGNTPGKALLGLQVITIAGARPTLGQFAQRQGALFLQGLWAGIPLASFIGQLWQFKRVSAGRPASYDEGKFSVVARPLGSVRIGVFCLIGVGFVVGHSYLQSLESWTNPVTSVKAKLPSGWNVREVKRDNGGQLYIFISTSHQLQGMLWRDHERDEIAAAHAQGAKAEALIRRGLARDAKATVAGLPTFGLTGTMEIEGKRRPVLIALIRDGADVWQFTVMGDPGGKVDAAAAQALGESVFKTMPRTGNEQAEP